jgi:hypothetical protein
VYSYAELSDNTLPKAEETAGTLLRRAGIQVEWLRCPGCKKPLGSGDVILHLVPRSLDFQGLKPEAFGFALDGTGGEPALHAYIFIDRAEKAVLASSRTSRPVSLTTLVAYVMVHEIGHLILGPNSHSARGIMRPRWLAADLQEMEMGRFDFPPDQATNLLSRLEAR